MSERAARRHVNVLDNEAVQAACDLTHPKYRQVASFIVGASQREKRQDRQIAVLVSTAARVEAGISRNAHGAAQLRRLRVRDVALDADRADECAELVRSGAATTVDATVAQLALEQRDAGATVSVYTADGADLRRLVDTVGGGVAVHRV